jgi:putative ABC transport system substrate-binding protein
VTQGAVGVLAWPFATGAQPANRPKVVAFVLSAASLADMHGTDPPSRVARAFIHGLRDRGWVEGRNIVIERRSPEGRPEQARAIFAELAGRSVDVIVVGGAPWLYRAAVAVVHTTPIVHFFTVDPVGIGFVESLSRPGGNVTGVVAMTGQALLEKRLQFLKELAPRISRVAFAGTRQTWEAYGAAGTTLGLELAFIPVDRADEFAAALSAIRHERANALFIAQAPVLYEQMSRVVAFAAEHRLPAAYPWREAVETGGLMSYGISSVGMFGQLAGVADRILRGASPADIPIEQPTTFELLINLGTARSLGLDVSAAMLALADEVIE